MRSKKRKCLHKLNDEPHPFMGLTESGLADLLESQFYSSLESYKIEVDPKTYTVNLDVLVNDKYLAEILHDTKIEDMLGDKMPIGVELKVNLNFTK